MNPPTTTTTVSATPQPNTRHPKDFILDTIEERSAIGLVARSALVVTASSIALTARSSKRRNRRSASGPEGKVAAALEERRLQGQNGGPLMVQSIASMKVAVM